MLKVTSSARGGTRAAFQVLLHGTALSLGGAALIGAGTATALAQPAERSLSIEEITITARRIGEALERVPVAVSAISGEQLAERSITSELDLQRTVPGLTVRTGQYNNTFFYSIRGQSLDLFTGSRPAVLPYINDVQLTSFSGSTFYDLESVQVLKGPQGTLFGRNVTGGAVLFSTAKPTNELEGFVTGRVGNYDHWKIQGALNVPVVEDKVLLRVAGDIHRRDGYQYNIYQDMYHGKIERESGRASLTLKPSERLENTAVFQYSHAGGDNLQLEAWTTNACGATNNGIPVSSTAACLFGPTLDAAIGVPGAWDIYRSLNPAAQPGGLVEQTEFQRSLGPWQVNTFQPSIHRSRNWFASNTTTYEIDDNLEFKNIFGVARARSFDEYDPTGSGPYFLQGQDSDADVNYSGPYTGLTQRTFQWSEEAQLLGQAFDFGLDYILGAYFAYQRDYFFAPVTFISLPPFIPKTMQINEFKNINKTQAVYGQATQDISGWTGIDGLSVTAGFRYTWEQVRLEHGPLATQQNFLDAPVNPSVISEKESFSNPSWTLGVEYQVSDDFLIYLAQRGSWRSGGFNGNGPARFATADEGGNLFGPEKTWDVELGAKYNGQLGAMPFRMNVALYNQWIKNVQRVVFTTPPPEFAIGGVPALQSLTVNVPKGRVRGVELDAMIIPTEWLQLGGSLAFTDAKFTDPTNVLFGETITYGPYGDTPKWSGTAFAAVSLPVPQQWGEMTLRGDLYSQTGQYFSNLAATVAPGTRIPGYTLVNLRLDWDEIMGSSVSLAAFATNLFKEEYYSGGIVLIPFGHGGVIPGEPRTYGLEARFRF